MSRRILVLTVGTSLLTSASWRPEGPFERLPGYGTWVREHLDSPSRRRADRSTGSRLERLLREGEPDNTPSRFAEAFCLPYSGSALRYSAEVSTLILWMLQQGDYDLAKFVRRKYSRIELVAPVETKDPANLAAKHLASIFEFHKIGQIAMRPVLTGPTLRDKVEQFKKYLLNFDPANQPVDLIVSGGYKIFAMYSGAFISRPQAPEGWRLIFLHEQSSDVIAQTRDDFLLDGEPLKIVGPRQTIEAR